MGSYKLTEDHPHEPLKAGAVVWDYIGYDYGCARDDSRVMGTKYITVTTKPDGSGPFITAPLNILRKRKD